MSLTRKGAIERINNLFRYRSFEAGAQRDLVDEDIAIRIRRTKAGNRSKVAVDVTIAGAVSIKDATLFARRKEDNRLLRSADFRCSNDSSAEYWVTITDLPLGDYVRLEVKDLKATS